MDIEIWLRSLGLSQYIEAFHENRVDGDVVLHLTPDDLKDLGVKLVGDRRKLLRAIEDLRQAGIHEPSSVEQSVSTNPEASTSSKAERRQLTVMFADLVGSTELSRRLDPEDLADAIRSYQITCARIIEKWDGHVAKYLGDGVLAFFGYPQAHEDDAERAVRAGLELTSTIGQLTVIGDVTMAARVGVATGMVMVGEIIGHGSAQEESVVGLTPNLAARLEALAQPGTLVIAAATRDLLGDLFELKDLGEHSLKGFSDKVRAWCVLGEQRTSSRFEAKSGKELTPLIGRDHELSLLQGLWRQAEEGEGQVALIAGEAGIGKSRLGQAMQEWLSDAPHIRLRYQCSPFHTNSALYPIVLQMERAAGISREEAAEDQLRKLEELLSLADVTSVETIALFAELLSLPTDRLPTSNLGPQLRKEKILEALVDQLIGLARRRPVLLLFEDLHWIDPTSLDLLARVVERIQDLRALAILTYRPDFQPRWVGQAHVRSLVLSRLGKRQGISIVSELAGGKALPTEVLAQIADKSDGVPLFVEELTKTVLESDLLEEKDNHFVLRGSLPPLAIPSSLQDSLLARLDRLATIKVVAQTGAVIGRDFSYRLLAMVSSLPEAELIQALNQLTDSELVFQRGEPPDAIYTFKHALVQDAAYQGLLRSTRQAIHSRIAAELEADGSKTWDGRPEVLAWHFDRADLAEKAFEYYFLAGQQSALKSLHFEAIAHLSRAYELLPILDKPGGGDQQRLEVLLALGPMQMAAHGIASKEAAATYSEAHALIGHAETPEQAYSAAWGLWLSSQQRGFLDQAHDLADEVLELAKQPGAEPLLLQAHHAAWTTQFFEGTPTSCLHHAEQGISLYAIETHKEDAFHYGGHDPGVCAYATGALTRWIAGYPDQSLQYIERGIELAVRIGHPVSHSIILFFKTILAQYLRSPDLIETTICELAGLCDRWRIPHYSTASLILGGWAKAMTGDAEKGLAEISEGLELHDRSPIGLRKPYYLGLCAEATAEAGDIAKALDIVIEAVDRARDSGDRHWNAELYRLRGELQLKHDEANWQAGIDRLLESLELAKSSGAKSFELRAATSLTRFQATRGNGQKASAFLRPVLEWFDEGFDTPDQIEAKRLLDELGQSTT